VRTQDEPTADLLMPMMHFQSTEFPNSGKSYLPNFTALVSPNQQFLPITARVNEQDRLEIGGCDVVDLVQRFGSPLYILDEETLRTSCRQYRDALKRYYPGDSQVFYASKAWSCKAICAIVASEGLGIDVMSGGELYTALQAGVHPEMLYLHGNNKSLVEQKLIVDSGGTAIVDNWLELQTLTDLAKAASVQHPIRIMLRLTPGIECHTHQYTLTGQIDSKFGFDPSEVDKVFAFVCQNSYLACVGLHAHIGSQIFELKPYRALASIMVEWFSQASNYGLPLKFLNLGGGLGIRYTKDDKPPSIEDWVKTISEAVITACEARKLSLPQLRCEPGRSLIGNAGVTAYTLGSRKEVQGVRTYLSVDGGMSDNPRPITYQATNQTVLANRMSATSSETVTIAGKHCESGDILFKDVWLPKAESGDILVAMGTGAYNYSQSSNYNRLPRPAAVLVSNEKPYSILQRETYQDLIQHDCLPPHVQL